MTAYAFNNLKMDLGKAISALSPFWQAILSIVKFFFFIVNRKKILQLLRDVWLWTLEATAEELEIIAEENKNDAKICGFYFSMVNISGVLAHLAPLAVASVYAWQGNGFLNSLDAPLKAEYFFNIRQSYITYIVCYLWNVISIYFIIYGSLFIDTLYSWLVHNISAQFRILSLRYRKLSLMMVTHKSSEIQNDEIFMKSIVECIQYHLRILEISKRFSEAYQHLVLIKFLISCLQLACLSFIIPLGGEMADQLFNLSFLVAATTQLILYCHGGQKIKDMSTSVNWTIYESFHWHNLSVKSQKLLLFVMMRTRKPCEINCIFFRANLNLFVWVSMEKYGKE
ncbi:odorant receptor 45a-like [Musca domestica]|uniref:Odorant receptor 45a-like n=1 Tax=Musca domestica TaxID=7370 RepID=A0A9J7D2E7_MUSDO|nr:odorant receptor 45a-like [Musca domestica]